MLCVLTSLSLGLAAHILGVFTKSARAAKLPNLGTEPTRTVEIVAELQLTRLYNQKLLG
jgi:hypothetical protein